MSPSDIKLISKFLPVGLQHPGDRCAAISRNVESYNNGEFRGRLQPLEEEDEDDF